MDIIERKFPAQDIRVFVNLLKWDNNEMLLLGTGSSATQLYPSDIDLFSKIFNNYNSDAVYKKVIQKLTEASQRPDMFFIEGKIQDKDGEKFKWKNMAELKRPASVVKFKSLYDNIDYVKFDFVLYLNQQFVELSVIYVFNKDDLDYSALKMSLSNDMIDLIHERKYYKSLKRLFALLKLEHPPARNNLIKISELFNSSIGALYKRNSILKAVELFLETYQDPESIRLAKRVYENLGFTNLTEMPKIIKAYDAVINREGKKFIMKMYPQLLKIKKSNKPIMVEGGKRVYRSAIVHADIMRGGADKSAKSAKSKEELEEWMAKHVSNYSEPNANDASQATNVTPVLQASRNTPLPRLPPTPAGDYESLAQFQPPNVVPVNFDDPIFDARPDPEPAYMVMRNPSPEPAPPARPPPFVNRATKPTGRGMAKKTSPWVEHCKKYAATHGVSYKQAMKDARASYKRKGAGNDDFDLNLPPTTKQPTTAFPTQVSYYY
jgi:hypothetical protein